MSLPEISPPTLFLFGLFVKERFENVLGTLGCVLSGLSPPLIISLHAKLCLYDLHSQMMPELDLILMIHYISKYLLDLKHLFASDSGIELSPILVNLGFISDRQLPPSRNLLRVGRSHDCIMPPILVIEPLVKKRLNLLSCHKQALRNDILHDLSLS